MPAAVELGRPHQQQADDHGEVARGVEEEQRREADRRDGEARDGRADDARRVEDARC